MSPAKHVGPAVSALSHEPGMRALLSSGRHRSRDEDRTKMMTRTRTRVFFFLFVPPLARDAVGPPGMLFLGKILQPGVLSFFFFYYPFFLVGLTPHFSPRARTALPSLAKPGSHTPSSRLGD